MREEAFTGLEPWLGLERDAGVAVLRFGADVLDIGKDLGLRQRLTELIERLAVDSSVRSLAILPGTGSLSPDRCDRFLEEVADLGRARRTSALTAAMRHEMWLSREVNWFRWVLRKTMSMPKPVVATMDGDMVLSLLGMALACDYRVVCRKLVLHNRSREIEIPPASGLLLLLPRYVGLGTARRILLREKSIDARTAFDLGLVDEVVAPENLEVRAREAASELGELPVQVVGGIKRMLLQHVPDQDKHFDREGAEILTSVRRLHGRP